MSQMCDPSNPLGVNASTNLCDKNKKVDSATTDRPLYVFVVNNSLHESKRICDLESENGH